jgi:nucleoside phosphorylase
MRHIGVVIALEAEARALTPRKLRLGLVEDLDGGVRVQVCGMGPAAAAAAALALAESGVAALAIYGVAGALDPGLLSGALLCPRMVLDQHGARYAVDPAWRLRLAARLGGQTLLDHTLLTVAEPLLTPQAKAEARREFKAAAVDMESAAVAEVAQSQGLPFLALRAIADSAQDSIPPPLAGAVDRWGRAKPGAVATALLSHPLLIPRLPHLASTMNRACATLRRAAQAAGPGLAYEV